MARLLLTNDDGHFSPGIHAMAIALRDAGHEVQIVAPSGERSGWGAGVGTLLDGVEVEVTAHAVPDADDIPTWAVDGPPAFCVLTAMMDTYGPRPDLVVSGINDGTNCGRGVLQSGTVGAALIAQNFGLSAMAISQDDTDDAMIWETGAAVSVPAVEWCLAAPRKTVLNVNVPNVALGELKGVRWGRLAAFGTSSTSLEGSVPGTLTVRITPRDIELKPDTDTALVAAGYVAVTGLTGIRAEANDTGPAAEAIESALG